VAYLRKCCVRGPIHNANAWKAAFDAFLESVKAGACVDLVGNSEGDEASRIH
jgi:hypothetical protein